MVLSILLEKKIDEKTIVDEVTQEELERGVVPSIQLEYTEVIREYINGIKYNTDKIKNGVVQEFNEVARIYNENYKNLS